MSAEPGVIFCATGKPTYIEQAILCARSVRRASRTTSVALFTDRRDYVHDHAPDLFDHVIDIESERPRHPRLPFIDKINCLQKTPFARTLFLDSDTYVFQGLDDLFRLLDRFDVVITHGHNRRRRSLAARGRIPDLEGEAPRQRLPASIPAAFAPMQGGLLLYNSGAPHVRDWLDDVKRHYFANDFYDDQVAMLMALWEREDIRLYCLPEEYNFSGLEAFNRWRRSGFAIAVPHILHYTAHKRDPERAVRRMLPYTDALPEGSSGWRALAKKLRQRLAF